MMYPKIDVVSLTNTFQKYINTCKSAFGIHPIHFLSTPSFTWKADLEISGLELDY